MKFSEGFYKKFQLWFWGIFAFVGIVVTSLFILVGLDFFGPLPSFVELENPKSNLASEIYSEDHVLLGTYFVQNRTYTDFSELSPNLVAALLATEDIRFYRHSGVDARSLVRVLVKTIILGQSQSGGGSTITQQLAKNLFPRDTIFYRTRIARTSNLVISKFKEWFTAVKLERNYTKNEIMAMYLNTLSYGSNAYGIRSAAKTFFNTTPDSLTIEEAAVLVGVVNAPTRYSPVRNPERSLRRRNFVISQMARYGFITPGERDSISELPLELDFMVQDHNVGLATYFREHIRLMMMAPKPNPRRYFMRSQYLEDSLQWATNPLYGWCNKNLKPDGTPYNLYRDGLKIYTTINSRMQNHAERSVMEHLGGYLQPAFDSECRSRGNKIFSEDLTTEQIDGIMFQAMRQTDRYRGLIRDGASNESIKQNFERRIPMTVFTWRGERDTLMSPMDSIRHYKRHLRAGFMAMDPRTGHVRVWVGGPNFRYFKYDHVWQGRRQVGSTIKPFLYTLAMQEGYSPCDRVPNVSQTFVVGDSTWTPRNSGASRYDGQMVTLKWGLAYSVNNISAWLMKRFNPKAVVDVITKMGVTSRVDPVLSVFLGTAELSVYEMVGAYSTFANRGMHIEPQLVTRIEDKNGNILATFHAPRTEAISDQTAYLMLNLMEGTVNQGTGIRLRTRYNLQGPIAGKTGTTQNHSDGWFMGIVPNLVAGVWVGAEDRSVRFQNIAMGQGANMALPIFALFLQKVYSDPSLGISPTQVWEKPIRMSPMNLDCPDKAMTDPNFFEGYEDDFF